MDYVHDPPLYSHFPSGYDEVLVLPVLGLEPHHFPLSVKPLPCDFFPVPQEGHDHRTVGRILVLLDDQ
jgi:hypothetical protein